METFSALLAICAGNSPVPVNSPHKGQWRGALMFSLICVWINGWVNNRKAGDLRHYRAHYDVIVMIPEELPTQMCRTSLSNWVISFPDWSQTPDRYIGCLTGAHHSYAPVLVVGPMKQRNSQSMMTPSNRNFFRVMGPLWGDSRNPPVTPKRPVTRSFDVFLWSAPEQTVKQTTETPGIWDAIALIMTSL